MVRKMREISQNFNEKLGKNEENMYVIRRGEKGEKK